MKNNEQSNKGMNMMTMAQSNAANLASFQEAMKKARIQGYAAGYASWGSKPKSGNPYPNGEDNPLGREWAEEFRLGRYERKMELSE